MRRSDPLCLVVMPSGKKKDATGRVVDFDAVYRRLIIHAVEAAGMRPLPGGDIRTGGPALNGTLEQLKACEYAVFDLTAGDPNVYYQLGLRTALSASAPVLVYAAGTAQLPVDVQHLSAVPYRVSPQGSPIHEAKYRSVLTARLKEAGSIGCEVRNALVETEHGEDAGDEILAREEHAAEVGRRLRQARNVGGEAVRRVEEELGDLHDEDPRVVLDLFLSYASVKWWDEMIALVPRMPSCVAGSVAVQQHLGVALNGAGRFEEAEQLVRELIARRGPCSESYGILGKILKEQWEKAVEGKEAAAAKELLQKAAAAYMKGFEADWRNTYPGVNAVTLMELREPADPRRREILPVVHYAVEQRIRYGAADYWDYATLLELAALSCDEAKGVDALGRCLARVREAWEPETTARELRLIREARQRRGAQWPEWTERAEAELLKAAERGTARP